LNRICPLEIPVIARKDLHPSTGGMSLEVGNSFLQGISGVLLRDRLGDRPDTEFILLQPGFEVADVGIQKVLLRFIKEADMRSPGQLLQGSKPGLPGPQIFRQNLFALMR
jgi:hypothetical protein